MAEAAGRDGRVHVAKAENYELRGVREVATVATRRVATVADPAAEIVVPGTDLKKEKGQSPAKGRDVPEDSDFTFVLRTTTDN